MEKRFGHYYYLRQDLNLNKSIDLKKENLPKELLGKKIIQIKDYDGLKLICQDESWLMFRGSGTEPIMRVYTEANNLNRAKKLLELGIKLVKSINH
jgi:phosphomannomutase